MKPAASASSSTGGTAKAEHFLTCSGKACCSYYLVYLTGDDVARLARTLGLLPPHFVVAVDEPGEHPDAFVLARDGPRYRLALVRTQIGESEPACAFLVRLAGGEARCGIGDARPRPCRIFPLELADGVVRISADGCTCGWSNEEIDVEAKRPLFAEDDAARATYHAVVARWNAYVAAETLPEAVTVDDYCRYLLDAYAP